MSGEKFAQLLTEAIYRIRTLEGKPVGVIQDELGYAIGKRGGSSIEHWRKGNVPSKQVDIELLARAILVRSDLDGRWLQQFLLNANYAFIGRLHDELFPPDPSQTGTTPLPTIPVHNNLPAQPTTFLGREQELTELAKYLRDPACRLLTLTGPGGIGKTRLALEAARRNAADEGGGVFPHGVCFVSLASLQSADFMASTIGNALNFAFFGGEELEEQLLSYLQEKRLLLIVDNLEHLVQETDLLAKIMLRAPHVKMMTTSRERLNLRGEWVMEIQGMSYPHLRVSSRFVSETAVADITSSLITTEWESYSAIKLFLQSAQQVCADFEPTEVDKLHIVQICQLVEGIPLAIELAASWVRVLTCAEIAREIEHNYEFLATSWRDVPERHRSLQAVFDYSWDLLSPPERQMIRKLSVFQRGFHREAALRVADASLLLLSALVDKSFLKPTRHGTSGVRYEIHDLLRQYAEEKLNAIAEEHEEAHGRHAYYFADFLHQCESKLHGSGQASALEGIGEEIENIRAGWHWMLEKQLADGLDKYVESLFQFYDIRSWSQEGLEAFGTAVRTLASSSDTQLLGKLLSRQGRFCYRLGQTSEARQILQQSLTLLEQFDVPIEEAFALNQLAYVAYRLGDHEQAMDLCQRSLALSRPLQANWQTAESLQILGEVVNVQGEYDEAKKIHQEGLQISKTLGDQRGLAVALNQIGYLDWRLGNYDEAWRSCEESLEICREVGDRRGIAMCHKNLGNIASELDDHLKAQKHYRRGLRISQEIGHTWGEAAFLNNLASEAWELAEYERAKELGEKSLAIWRETGYQLGMASTLETLGTIAEAMDLYEESKAYFLEALAITLDIGTRPLSLDILGGLGILLAKAGDIARAVEVLTFVLNHPMSDQETKVKVGRRLPQFISQLSPEAFTLAEAKSLQESFEQIVAELLN